MMGDNKLVKLSFVGDIMCQKELNNAVYNKYGAYVYDDVFINVKNSKIFKDSSLIIGNLETPISNNSLSLHQIVFSTPPSFLKSVKDCGIDVVSTANNHCLDMGIEGLETTIKELDRVGIAHTGTYISKTEAENITVIEANGIKFAFVACTFGTNSEVNGNILHSDELWRVDLLKRQNKKSRLVRDASESIIEKYIPDNVPPVAIGNAIHVDYITNVKNKISKAKAISDVVIVIPHIGGQYNPAPASYTRSTVKWLAETEADIIIAGHPHVPLGYEIINRKFCAYSLGNFSFTPGVGYFLPNVLAEFGIVLHTYWNVQSKQLENIEFSLVYNVNDIDGITQVKPIVEHYSELKNSIERDKFRMEVEAIVNRVTGSHSEVDIQNNYKIL